MSAESGANFVRRDTTAICVDEEDRFVDIVLGAGIVGVSTALHLRLRGHDVVLLDRDGPGMGTSFGNAGLIENSDLMPRGFPREWGEFIHYALGKDPGSRNDLAFLPRLAPWLFDYWRHSGAKNLSKASLENAPLFLNSLGAHKELMDKAGALHLLRDDGWLHLYRTKQVPAAKREGVKIANDHGMTSEILDGDEVAAREPALKTEVKSGVHWRAAATISDPLALTQALVALFEKEGGRVVNGDAASLVAKGAGWVVTTTDGPLEAERVVVALGPWSDLITKRLGYRIPMAIKRGYHMHYAIADADRPRLPVIDAENGYAIAPMTGGMRLTTGVEFAARDAAPSDKTVDRCEPSARQLFALGGRVDNAPWLGRRPTISDLKPVIGPGHRHKNIWFAFGHAHHGLTLGPITGRLLAQQMDGDTPQSDLTPFAPARFG